MSRIDEALKKVAATAAAAEGRGAKAVLRPIADDITLDHYPVERVVTEREEPRPRPRPADPDRPAANRPAATATVSAGLVDSPFEGKLVTEAVTGVSVEQYRRLAAAMHELHQHRNLKTVMVTSTVPGEGKTLTVTNLALTLSKAYERRVLLIDADLRRPSVHRALNVRNTTGLSEALQFPTSELSLRAVTPTLTLLTAGQGEGSPMALLTSDRMQRLLDEAASAFDWVLLDAPPVGFMPDAGLLAGMTRAVLFVIAAGVTPFSLIQRATAELGHDAIIGTVLNRIADENIPATGYYDSYYSRD